MAASVDTDDSILVCARDREIAFCFSFYIKEVV